MFSFQRRLKPMTKQVTLIIYMLVACLLSVSTAAKAGYVACKVARIEYGKQDSQIGVYWVDENKPNPEGLGNEGVQGLSVDSVGNIYLGDYVNGKVKKFSKDGKLLVVTEGSIENLQSFMVDRSGNIFVHNEGMDSRLSKFDSFGKLAWSHSFPEVMSGQCIKKIEKDFNIDLLASFAWGITSGPGDSLIMELNGWDTKTNKPKSLGLQLDKDGKVVKVLPAFGFAANGEWIGFEASKKVEGGPPQSVNARVYRADGTLAKRIALDTKANNGSHYAGVTSGTSTVLPDRRGGFITVSYARLLNPVKLSRRAIISAEVVLNRYDGNGRFVAHLRVPGSPFGGIASNIMVSPDGSIYHLKFDKQGFDVIRHTRAGR